MTWYRVKPERARVWHAADSWTTLRGGVTLCNREFVGTGIQVLRADAPELVECEECRTVLSNRAQRSNEEVQA